MITVNLYYQGANGSARAFAEEMEASGVLVFQYRTSPGKDGRERKTVSRKNARILCPA